MTMRLEVEFPRPLTREQRTVVALVVATLAKADRVRFVRGDHGAVVSGEALGAARLREALADEGIAVEAVVSSLIDTEEEQVDEAAAVRAKERVRAIGR